MRRRLALGVCLAVVGAMGSGSFWACGGSASDVRTPDSGGPALTDARADGSETDGRVPVLKYDGGTEATACVDHCSADLHEVLDCANRVVKTCPATEGCGPGGACISACESAAANLSTVGCDYYSIVPGKTGTFNECFAAYVANTWNGPVKLTVEYQGFSIPIDNFAVIPTGSGASITYAPLPGGMLPAGQLAILFLVAGSAGPFVSCPTGVVPAVQSTPVGSYFTEVVDGFHITSSAPVAAYDIFPYGGAPAGTSSATLLIPTAAWGKNYLAVDSYEWNGDELAQPFIQIVAASDDTQVTLNPTVPIVGGPVVPGAAAGVPTTYKLNGGQVLQLKQKAELNGTPIQSNKPVGVWGGSSCMNINPNNGGCDSGHQELFPVNQLGNEYVAVRYRPRNPAMPDEAPPWRIMGAVDGTMLTYDPPTPPAGAPTALDASQLVLFYSAGPFVVKSQDNTHPFYLSAHMGGENFLDADFLGGDPEHVNVVPPQQYMSNYIFMTDPTFGNTNLVLVRQMSTMGTFDDVTLDCQSGPVSPWTPVGSGTYEFAWVDLVVSVNDAGVPQGACDNGYHTIKSNSPFGLTVWGWDQYVSYAYPGGARVQSINSVVVPAVPK